MRTAENHPLRKQGEESRYAGYAAQVQRVQWTSNIGRVDRVSELP